MKFGTHINSCPVQMQMMSMDEITQIQIGVTFGGNMLPYLLLNPLKKLHEFQLLRVPNLYYRYFEAHTRKTDPKLNHSKKQGRRSFLLQARPNFNVIRIGIYLLKDTRTTKLVLQIIIQSLQYIQKYCEYAQYVENQRPHVLRDL